MTGIGPAIPETLPVTRDVAPPAPLRGVLNVNKPSGISSYDVIRRLKPLLPRGTAIGHAGTLDPLASGVLLVLVGDATKVSRFLLSESKVYETGILFGIRTDSDDVTGRIVERAATPSLGADGIGAALDRFTGEIEQVPPSYSALKQGGRPQYELARQGLKTEARPRRVTIHELQLLDWQPPRLALRCRVSSGTYVRALARDIGSALGSAATLESLVRTMCGRFCLSDATALDDITAYAVPGLLATIAHALPGMPRLDITPADASRLLQGRRVATATPPVGPGLARTSDDRFLAVVRAEGGELLTERIIYAR